jgi:hypothetical protein
MILAGSRSLKKAVQFGSRLAIMSCFCLDLASSGTGSGKSLATKAAGFGSIKNSAGFGSGRPKKNVYNKIQLQLDID